MGPFQSSMDCAYTSRCLSQDVSTEVLDGVSVIGEALTLASSIFSLIVDHALTRRGGVCDRGERFKFTPKKRIFAGFSRPLSAVISSHQT